MLLGRKFKSFRKTVKDYYRSSGRDLPWRHTNNPYRIVISEIMLQQTQVSRVLIKYPEFLRLFPHWKSLSQASTARVIKAWQGLGYNRRALALKEIARHVVNDYGGRLPRTPEALALFPGIGPATAASICAFAFNKPVVFIETNIRRVFLYHFFSRRTDVSDSELLPLITATLDKQNPREWYWALMDYGSYLAKKVENPNRKSKHYSKQSKFVGSRRQTRGAILKLLSDNSSMTMQDIITLLPDQRQRVVELLGELVKEKFLQHKNNRYKLATTV